MKASIKNNAVGLAYIAIACTLMLSGLWMYHEGERPGDLAKTVQLTAVDENLLQIASEISSNSPIPSGSGLIMGASYDLAKNTFTFDLRANPELFEKIPEELFFIATEDALNCAKQTRLLIEMNRDTIVQYRLYNMEGALKNLITLDRGECSVLPIITAKNVTGATKL